MQILVRKELQRLPTKYRAALILVYLEGKSKEETAFELCLPIGTVSCQLSRGRELLRRRLIRYGFFSPEG